MNRMKKLGGKLIDRYDKKKENLYALIKTFLDQKDISQVNMTNLRNLVDTSDEVLRGLNALGTEATNKDPWLIQILMQKLDTETKRLWSVKTAEKDFPTLKEFLEFLNVRCSSLELMTGSVSQQEISNIELDAVNTTLNSSTSVNNAKCVSFLPTAKVLLYNNEGGSFLFRALLDSGSESSFISENAINILGLKGCNDRLSLSGISEIQAGTRRGSVPRSGQNSAKISLQLKPDEDFSKPSECDIILGSDCFFSILRNGRITRSKGQPITQNPIFCWIVAGVGQILQPDICTLLLWLLKLNWDEALPEHFVLKWKKFQMEFQQVCHLSIPRWLQITNKKVTLRGFSDESEAAYACVVYAVQRNRETTKVMMLGGKSKVAPLKLICIPRLELNGALLLARFFETLCNCLKDHVINIYGWTESQVVLSWLSSPLRNWKPFVTNKTSEILDIIPCKQWCYVPSKENPGDLGSTGMSPKDLPDCSLWWEGPQLLSSEEAWPKQPIIKDKRDIEKSVIIETKRTFVFSVYCKNDIIDMLFDKHSSFSKIIHILAFYLRFMQHCRDGKNKKRSRVGEEIIGPPETVEESKLTLKGRWDIVQKLKLNFWKRWQIDYLNSIQGRTKWKSGTSNIKIGDVVIIKEDNLPPSVWPLGKVISTHPGKDGIVRVVTLKTKKGLYQRPIVKLCILPVHQE
ncbi:DUF5641 domain-containing protein [Trichonephila clavipes]|nr:DUF5641 domain-containing protein [Trichonephila clavipes]